MQVSIQKPEPPKVFQPFSLTITFQSQEEVDQFYAIHDHWTITNATQEISHATILAMLAQSCERIGTVAFTKLNQAIIKKAP